MRSMSSWLARLALLPAIVGMAFSNGIVSASDFRSKETKSPPSVIIRQSNTPSTAAVLVSPKTGTRIEWQVVGAGATKSTVDDLIIEGTAGQTAIGQVVSPNFLVNQGFWQPFEPACLVGDVDNSGGVDISDAVYIIQYIFIGGPAPVLACTGDLTGDGIVDISDAVAILFLIFYQ